MNSNLFEFANKGNILVFAGAGVSAGQPSSLPTWKTLATSIAFELCNHLESDLNRPDWLINVKKLIESSSKINRFPPEYQAQLLEEMSGELYFKALQSIDIGIINENHYNIAKLAKRGAIKAIVTTNFDRLIEKALDQQDVKYEVAYEDNGYKATIRRLQNDKDHSLQIIKLHGCVSDHLSMIDTLKQRKLGRSNLIKECLQPLFDKYWIYLGFSAADLDGNPKYLGLQEGASKSLGSTYVSYPGNPTLSKGAELLMRAYGGRGDVIVCLLYTSRCV